MNNVAFTIYMIVVLIFGYGQPTQMLESTQGIILSMFLANLFFVFYMFKKSFNVYIDKKNVENAKVLMIYSLAVIIYLILSVVFAIKQTENLWQIYDTTNVLILILVFGALIFLTDKKTIINLSGAVVKSIPQMTFAVSILMEGNLGVSLEMIIAFHILTLPRVYSTLKQWRLDKQNVDKKSMLLTEVSNETSWCFVTLAFLITWMRTIWISMIWKSRFPCSFFISF